MKKQLFAKVKTLVDASSHVLLVTDERSDGDTFGSSLAFKEHLESLGKQATLFASSEIPDMLKFLPGIDAATRDRSRIGDPSIDLVIVFDSSREQFIRDLVGVQIDRNPSIVFDHHATNDLFGDVNVVDASCTSTCEIVHDYFLHHGIEMSRDMAKNLMTGLMTDTRVLTNRTTTPDAVLRAGKLLISGGSIDNVVENVLENMPFDRLRLWGRIFERVVRMQPHNAAVVYVTQQDMKEFGADHEDIGEVMDYLQATLDVELTMFLKEYEDGVKVSMRSTSIDASKIAKAFGGGGHPGACGFFVKGKIEERDGKVLIV